MEIFNLKEIQFNGFFGQIKAYLNKVFGDSSASNKSTVVGQLFTAVSSIAHNIMLYIEDALVEQNKFTAQRKKSIMGLAALSGYQSYTGRASTVNLVMSTVSNNETGLSLILPAHCNLMCSKNGLYYITSNNSPVVIDPADNHGSITINAIQGTLHNEFYTTTGGPLSRLNINYTGYLDDSFLKVKVNNEDYVRKASLYDMKPNEKSYFAAVNPVSGYDIIFGNDVNGRALLKDDAVEVEYLTHDGSAGNIESSTDTQFVFTSTLYDTAGNEVNGNDVLNVYIRDNASVAAGSDPESLSTIANMIGYQSRTGVLVDANSYRDFISQYQFIGYNRTWSEPNSLIINTLAMRNYKNAMATGLDYFNLKDSDFILSDQEKSSIYNAMIQSGKMLAGSIYNIIDIKLVKYAMFVYVTLKDKNVDKKNVETQIRTQIGEFFGNISSDQYIPKSDIIATLKDNISVLDGVNVYIMSEPNEQALIDKQYTKKTTIYDQSSGTYKTTEEIIPLYYIDTITENRDTHATTPLYERGQYTGQLINPMLGLDSHGNIKLDSDYEFPVLMGGWKWKPEQGSDITATAQALTVVFE